MSQIDEKWLLPGIVGIVVVAGGLGLLFGVIFTKSRVGGLAIPWQKLSSTGWHSVRLVFDDHFAIVTQANSGNYVLIYIGDLKEDQVERMKIPHQIFELIFVGNSVSIHFTK